VLSAAILKHVKYKFEINYSIIIHIYILHVKDPGVYGSRCNSDADCPYAVAIGSGNGNLIGIFSFCILKVIHYHRSNIHVTYLYGSDVFLSIIQILHTPDVD
jgi:hypothetical protein